MAQSIKCQKSRHGIMTGILTFYVRFMKERRPGALFLFQQENRVHHLLECHPDQENQPGIRPRGKQEAYDKIHDHDQGPKHAGKGIVQRVALPFIPLPLPEDTLFP